jgi:Family of unknown function (DUF6069)
VIDPWEEHDAGNNPQQPGRGGRGHGRWWPFIGSTALAISMLGPSYLADGSSAVSLICLHVVVGVVLITGFMRAVPNPYWIADAAAGRPWYRG